MGEGMKYEIKNMPLLLMALIIFNIGMGGLQIKLFTIGNIFYNSGWFILAFFGNYFIYLLCVGEDIK